MWNGGGDHFAFIYSRMFWIDIQNFVTKKEDRLYYNGFDMIYFRN
jgi:hypothetical protein